MDVKPATLHDIPRLCELLDLLFEQEAEFQPDHERQVRGLAAIINDTQAGQILVLWEQERIIGMVNLLFTVSTALGGRVAILEDMVVDASCRGGGAGSSLLLAAIESARRAGCLRITLLTDTSNRLAQTFYARHGFALSDMVPMRCLLD